MKSVYSYETHILAIWPHPDDVEVGCGGVLAQSAQKGKRSVIVDLCPSQLSTHGDCETRLQEAVCAAEILWVVHRENLQLQDGTVQDDKDTRLLLAKQIRTRKPEIVMMPWKTDRHPDHEIAATLVKNAVFYAWLQKMDIDGLSPHKPRLLVHYMIRGEFEPDFIVQLDEASFKAKMQAFRCYASQKKTNEWWLEYLEARHVVHGNRIGCRYGEWFKLYSHAVGVTWFDCVMSGFF